MYQHRHGACFAGLGHLLRAYGKKPLVLRQGEPGGSGDVGAGYDQSEGLQMCKHLKARPYVKD